jgi:hypothetical protein
MLQMPTAQCAVKTYSPKRPARQPVQNTGCGPSRKRNEAGMFAIPGSAIAALGTLAAARRP